MPIGVVIEQLKTHMLKYRVSTIKNILNKTKNF